MPLPTENLSHENLRRIRMEAANALDPVLLPGQATGPHEAPPAAPRPRGAGPRDPDLRAPVVAVRRRQEQAIRELFGMSATRYYQILNALIDCPDALAFDPMLVKRLRRLRTARQRARAGPPARSRRLKGPTSCPELPPRDAGVGDDVVMSFRCP